MEKILIFIKHNIRLLWQIIDWSNDIIFCLFFKPKLENLLPEIFKDFSGNEIKYRKLNLPDIQPLFVLIKSQLSGDLEYFNPHGFDLNSLEAQVRKPAFLMMGAFNDQMLIGYFFLRFFANRKCFVGRLIDKDYRGQGIGEEMNRIMYETAWRMNFRCYSTISKKNNAIMQAHSKNKDMIVLKELKNDYLLVEFIKNEKCTNS